MKIRNGYVSNSSSSSFIINDFDKKKIIALVDKFVEQFSLDKAWYTDENVTKTDIKNCILDKINNTENQDKYLNIYIKSFFDTIFHNYTNHFIWKRETEMWNCSNCEYYLKSHKKCTECPKTYWNKQQKSYKKTAKDTMDIFDYFDFSEMIKTIKKMVYKSDIEILYDQKRVKSDWDKYYELFDKWEELFFNKWKEKYPNAYVLNFSSDEGSYIDAYMRFNLTDFIAFMYKNNIDGLKGENS